MQNEIHQQFAKNYILGGECKVVFHNEATKQQRKFTIYQHHSTKHRRDWTPSNLLKYKVFTMEEGFHYVGYINKDTFTYVNDGTVQPKIGSNFAWIWKQILDLTVPDEIHILHMGQCSVCGRPLSDAESLEKGIGPICEKRIIIYQQKL